MEKIRIFREMKTESDFNKDPNDLYYFKWWSPLDSGCGVVEGEEVQD